MEMNAKELKRILRELQLYSTPELNDKIYLHYKGERSDDETPSLAAACSCRLPRPLDAHPSFSFVCRFSVYL